MFYQKTLFCISYPMGMLKRLGWVGVVNLKEGFYSLHLETLGCILMIDPLLGGTFSHFYKKF